MLTVRIFLLLLSFTVLFAQPQPGDVFREYKWTNVSGDAGGALRVGGRQGTTDWGTQIVGDYWETKFIYLTHDLDLEGALRAEVNVEKILCHDDTYGLGICINGHDWIDIPEAENIPAPQWKYQHHIYPTVDVPVSQLKSGGNNTFKMRVNKDHTWNWPQNLIYGVHIRVYYDGDQKSHPAARITSPGEGAFIDGTVTLDCEASSPNGEIERIDYIGHYIDVNFKGDGIYEQWHYHFFHGDIINHIGSATKSPFKVEWDTDWVPDQQKPIKIAARVTDETGMIYMTKAVNAKLHRDSLMVELCRPYNIPQKWVTRKGEFTEMFDVTGDVSKIIAFQLVWASWSPGYMNGIYVNDRKVFDKEGPKYAYYAHRVTVKDTGLLKQGVNTLKTGKTPLVNGKMVHGAEIEWPGIMVLVQFKASPQNSGGAMDYKLYQNYPNPFYDQTAIYFDLFEPARTSIRVYNVIGQEVLTLLDAALPVGVHRLRLDGAALPAGPYFYNLEVENEKVVRKKMMVVK